MLDSPPKVGEANKSQGSGLASLANTLQTSSWRASPTFAFFAPFGDMYQVDLSVVAPSGTLVDIDAVALSTPQGPHGK